jgi:diamine N-acetyltransferase
VNFEIIHIHKNQIDQIKPLWEKLNSIHQNKSPYFKSHYESFTFEKRAEKFINTNDDHILIETAKTEGGICGYCISTINNNVGEIESLYVSEKMRSNGIGTILVNNSLEWMKKRACNKIQVSVSYGHESVFDFYQKFGLYPRLTYLQLNT